MSILKKLAGETAIYGLSSILGRLLNYVILTPYLTRSFTNRAEYGIVTELYAYIALLIVVFTFRMETTYFRYAGDKGQSGNTFSTATFFLILTTAATTLFAMAFIQPIANWLDYPDRPEYVALFLLILALDTLATVPFARLRLDNRPGRFAFIRLVNIFSNLFFIFFFLECCPWLIENGCDKIKAVYDPSFRVGYVFLANLLASLITFLQFTPMIARMAWRIDRALLKKMLWYTAPLILGGLAGAINQFIGNPMLKFFTPGTLSDKLTQLGLFGAAAKIPILMTLFTQAFNYAAEPFFFRHAQREDAKDIYAQVAQAFTLVGSLVFLGIMLYLDLIAFLIGPKYREATGIVPILLMAYLFLGIYYCFSVWYKLADKTIAGGFFALGGSAITIGLNIFLIPRIGYYGPAWAALACYGFMVAACYLSGQRYFHIHYPIGRMTGYILLALAGYGLSLLNNAWLAANLPAKLTANTLVMTAFLLAVAFLEKNKIKQLLKSLPKSARPK
ncbi:MAG: lipopolysaccharide biosynthesis protein [Saprospiraceae bacterium]